MTCGPGRLGNWLVPDKLFGLDMTAACRWHDWAYTNPGGLTKRQIDGRFYKMMLAQAKTPLQRFVAWLYFWAVSRGHLSWWRCRLIERMKDEG